MDNFNQLVNWVLNTMREGFHSVNAVEGLVIAVIATLLLSSWSRLIIMAIGATIVTLILDVLLPVIEGTGKLKLPDNMMDVRYWQGALILLVGYIVVIAILFFLKRLFFRGGH